MKLSKLDLGLGAGLALAALFTRLPWRTQYLYHWDSVNFAFSLEHFDVRLHQPHPPGYFLYSMLGRLVNIFVQDGNASLVGISLVSGVLGVIAMYWLGLVTFDRKVGLIGALLTLVSPIHWFHSVIALTYALEFLLVTVISGLCYMQWQGSRHLWLVLAILLGLAGGIRQNDLVFLLPLWLVSLWPLTWTQRAASLVVLAACVVAWLAPMMWLSGGISGYLSALRGGSEGILQESPFVALEQLALNSVRLAIYVAYGLGAGVLALLLGVMSWLTLAASQLNERRTWFFVLWIAPAAMFYAFVHIRQPGHIFTFLPALLLLVAAAVQSLGFRFHSMHHTAIAVLTSVLLIANAGFYLLVPASLLGSQRLPLQTPSVQTLQVRDRFLNERLTYIQTHFDPMTTVVVAGGLDFRHPEYYLRDYQLPTLSSKMSTEGVDLPPTVHTLVIFNDLTLPGLIADLPIQEIRLTDGTILRYFRWDDTYRMHLSPTHLTILPALLSVPR